MRFEIGSLMKQLFSPFCTLHRLLPYIISTVMVSKPLRTHHARATEAGPAAILRRLAEQGGLRWNLVIVVAVFITRIPGLFFSFLSEDEAIYSALASRILAGFAPYTGAGPSKCDGQRSQPYRSEPRPATSVREGNRSVGTLSAWPHR
jgi:hypothetical protein